MKRMSTILTLVLTFVGLAFTCNIVFGYQASNKTKVIIKWFGHSSFGISDNKGMQIVTDPFGEGVGCTFPKGVSTNILTVSHQHFDHNNIKALEKYQHYIKDLGKFSYNNINIRGIASYHDEKKGALRGPNTIYTYKIDQISICHLGDLGHLLTKEEKNAIGKVDILMIPVGGLYTIDAKTAVKVVKQVNPKIVIPMHYKTEVLPKDFGDLAKVDEFISAMKGWKVERPDSLKISKADLDKSKGKTIVVPSYK